jgi:hypothetical protein
VRSHGLQLPRLRRRLLHGRVALLQLLLQGGHLHSCL